jgi:cytochrome c553
MKIVKSKIAVLAIAGLVAIAAAASHTQAASVRNCTWCHGVSAQGYGPAPRLAGQHHQYIVSQLHAFSGHTRDNPFSKQYMWGAAVNLGPSAARDLANYFAELPPEAASDGNRSLAATGEAIYERGNPAANIVSCAVCHGPHGEGIRQIPRLAGLSYYYLKRRLNQWQEGYHQAAAAPMPQVARELPPDVIEALASYLSFVK